MNKLKLLIMITFTALLSGCALTDYAKDYFAKASDSNRYEEARDIDSRLCDADILKKLRNVRSKKWYDQTLIDCDEREKVEAKTVD
mgnify:CR=1 FL=1